MPAAPQVLLIEDNEHDALLIESALRGGGFPFAMKRIATLEAMEAAIRRQLWDVILSHHTLKGFSARDVLQQLKECCPETAVIIISDRVSEEVIVETVKAGARDYFIKPNLTRLPAAVEREIGETRERRRRQDLEEQLRHAQRLESLGVLAGGVAHDFNNILTGVLGNASLATEILHPDSQALPLIEAVVSAAEHAALLTRQLLAYAGKGKHFIEQIDLSALVRASQGLLRLSVSRNISVGLELAEDLPSIAVDRGQVEQVLMNLVINGAEAIGTRVPGSVTVRTGIAQMCAGPLAGNVAGQSLGGGEYVYLEISDSGPGISPEVQSRMFDPFFTTKFTGRGLGLSAALGVVRAHAGALVVRTNAGEGSTFTTYFPLSTGAVRMPQEVWNPVGMLSGLVLVIDDEEMVRRTAQSVLQQHGLSVVSAENGAEGIDLFRRLTDRVSLVLLDLTMPVLTGGATLKAIREIRRDVPVLISSGYSEEDARQQFEIEEGVRFLQKPYTSMELARAVQQAIKAPAR